MKEEKRDREKGEAGERGRERKREGGKGERGTDGGVGEKESEKPIFSLLGALLEPQSCDAHPVISTKRPKELKNHQPRGSTC